MIVVSEPGVYHLVSRSRKPIAGKFQRWVRHDLLMNLRRTGKYAMSGAASDDAKPEVPADPAAEVLGHRFDEENATNQRVSIFRRSGHRFCNAAISARQLAR